MEISEMKTVMPEIKITVDGSISRFDSAEENISVHEDIVIETIQNEAQKEKRLQKINNS